MSGLTGDLSRDQLSALSVLNVVGADEEYEVRPHANGDLCIMRAGMDGDPLATLTRFDYDNLFARRILIATARVYSEDESQKYTSKFRIQRQRR